MNKFKVGDAVIVTRIGEHDWCNVGDSGRVIGVYGISGGCYYVVQLEDGNRYFKLEDSLEKMETGSDTANKDSKVEVLAIKTISIPTEIKFEGHVYVLKEYAK